MSAFGGKHIIIAVTYAFVDSDHFWLFNFNANVTILFVLLQHFVLGEGFESNKGLDVAPMGGARVGCAWALRH